MVRYFLFSAIGLFGILLCVWLLRLQIAEVVISGRAKESRSTYLASSPQSDFEEHWDTIQADAKALERYEVFAQTSVGKVDAGPYLNPLVNWDSEIKGTLDLSPEVAELLRSTQDFTSLKPEWGNLNLDFSWFQKLHQFDHWNFDSHPPLYGNNEVYRAHAAPMPLYTDLILWAKLRLLKGRDDGDLLSALKDVRQLARLVHSNENLISSMSAIGLLSAERAMVESLAKTSKNTSGWKTITLEDHARARRFYWAQAAFVDLRLSDELFTQTSSIPVGICQRVHEGIHATISFRRILRTDFEASFKRLDQLIEKTEGLCRHSFLRRMWKDPSYQAMFKPGEDIFVMASDMGGVGGSTLNIPRPFRTTIEDVEKVPSFAKALVYLLISLGEPNFLRHYENSPDN